MFAKHQPYAVHCSRHLSQIGEQTNKQKPQNTILEHALEMIDSLWMVGL